MRQNDNDQLEPCNQPTKNTKGRNSKTRSGVFYPQTCRSSNGLGTSWTNETSQKKRRMAFRLRRIIRKGIVLTPAQNRTMNLLFDTISSRCWNVQLLLPFGSGKTLCALLAALLVLPLLYSDLPPNRSQTELHVLPSTTAFESSTVCFYVTLPSLRQQVENEVRTHLERWSYNLPSLGSSRNGLPSASRFRVVSKLDPVEFAKVQRQYRTPVVVVDEYTKFIHLPWFRTFWTRVQTDANGPVPFLLLSGAETFGKVLSIQKTDFAAVDAARHFLNLPSRDPSSSSTAQKLRDESFLGRKGTDTLITFLELNQTQTRQYLEMKRKATEPEHSSGAKEKEDSRPPRQKTSAYWRLMQNAEILSSWKIEPLIAHYGFRVQLGALAPILTSDDPEKNVTRAPSQDPSPTATAVAVFSSFPKVLRQLEKKLQLVPNLSDSVVVVNTARMKPDERGKFLARLKRQLIPPADHIPKTQKNSFLETTAGHRGSRPRYLLLCSVDSLGHGADLAFCQELVAIDLIYNHRSLEQLKGRLSRIGQIPGQKLHFLLFAQTFEEKIFRGNADVSAQALTLQTT